MPLAEEIGFIVPIGEWVLRSACAAAAKWPDDLKVAVNLSPAQFRSSALPAGRGRGARRSGLAPERLELEITETALLEDKARLSPSSISCASSASGVAMDDFGTGYSSLSYLQSFPFDKIKDRPFVREDITERHGSLKIVRAVTALAQGLGMATTAEGVETQGQLDTVKSEGCTEMQGFHFSRARPLHEIEQLFLSNRKARKDEASAA